MSPPTYMIWVWDIWACPCVGSVHNCGHVGVFVHIKGYSISLHVQDVSVHYSNGKYHTSVLTRCDIGAG